MNEVDIEESECNSITSSKPSNKKSPQHAARSLVELRAARETRAAETMKMKDEQIRILTEQNSKLLEAVDRGEEEISTIQLEKLHVEEENRRLRESNFHVQSNARVTDDELDKMRSESESRDKQLKVMTAQNAELLRLLEAEETTNAKLAADSETTEENLRQLKVNFSTLENKAKSSEELATKSIRECQLRADELRLLRAEMESMRNKHKEYEMKSSVEIESLQEQLRVRKEKQYQLLEKLQSQETSRRHAEDQVCTMEEKIRELHTKSSSVETKLQLEISSKLSKEDMIKKLTFENQTIVEENKQLMTKMQKLEQDQVRIEGESRESGDQLREMAEKVFQLLERLKLAELGKTRSMEALHVKEEEVHTLKKKNANLIKESTKEGKLRVQAQLDKQVLEDQIRALKKHITQLGNRCKEEAKLKVRAEDEQKELQEKVQTLNGRLSFLLNKLQTDEEAKSAKNTEIEKLQSQLESQIQTNQITQKELVSCKSEIDDLKRKNLNHEEEFQSLKIKHEALQQLVSEQEELRTKFSKKERQNNQDENPLLAGGRLRFYIESKPTLGIVTIQAKTAKDKEWLETMHCNTFLRKATKSQNTQELLLQKLAELYGIMKTYDDEIEKEKTKYKHQEEEMNKLNAKLHFIHKKLGAEEESKRRTLLRYINAVKASVSLGEPGCEKDREEVGRLGAGKIYLPDANLTDEEVHAIAALLRGNETIADLNLRGNRITDDGCRAIASLLSAPTALKAIDLRDNKIGQNGVKMIVESLERSSRVRHVYVHAGGKVEALGTNNASVRRDKFNLDPADDINYLNDELEKQTATTSVETVCVVDMRGNTKNEDSNSLKEKFLGLPITCGESVCNTSRDEKSQREGSTTKGIKKNKTAKPKISQEDREKRRKAKEIRDTIESEKRIREEGWNGRAGGLDISMMTKGIDKNSSFSSDSKRKAFDMTMSKDAISSRPESACTSIDSCTNESGIEPMKISPFAQDLQQL